MYNHKRKGSDGSEFYLYVYNEPFFSETRYRREKNKHIRESGVLSKCSSSNPIIGKQKNYYYISDPIIPFVDRIYRKKNLQSSNGYTMLSPAGLVDLLTNLWAAGVGGGGPRRQRA
jgi:hypothetical protein